MFRMFRNAHKIFLNLVKNWNHIHISENLISVRNFRHRNRLFEFAEQTLGTDGFLYPGKCMAY